MCASLGIHRLSLVLLAGNVAGIGVAVTISRRVGPEIAWLSDLPAMCLLGTCAVLWVTCLAAGRHRHATAMDTLLAVLCLLLVSFWISPMQYLVGGLGRPLVDPLLAQADAALGIHTPTLAAWTRDRPGVTAVLALAYVSLLPQFLAVGPLVGIYLRHRERLWEYVWHFHVGAGVTLGAWMLFPAASAFQYYAFEPAFDESRFIAHFVQLRSGTLGSLQLSHTEGLISMPSFHVLGAIMVTWAVRSAPRVLIALIPVNVLLIASTVMSGVHYAVDVIGAGAVFAFSLVTWHGFARPALYVTTTVPPSPG